MEQDSNLPKFSGTLQTNSKNPKFRKKLGTITLWENKSENPRAPAYVGEVSTNYGKSQVALWKFTPKKSDSSD